MKIDCIIYEKATVTFSDGAHLAFDDCHVSMTEACGVVTGKLTHGAKLSGLNFDGKGQFICSGFELVVFHPWSVKFRTKMFIAHNGVDDVHEVTVELTV
jgi:hypothetical protein